MRKLLLLLLLASVPLWFTACGDDKPPCDSAAGPGCADAGVPIIAAPEVWTWVDVAGTACGNGARTGIGINPTTLSQDLYLYMQGGGACWNEQTCFIQPSASHLSTGYQAAQFQAENTRNAPMFNRGKATNPFRGMSFVFVPYCTGDVHAGNAVQTYGSNQVHHKGAANVQAWLPRLAATFPNVRRVFLAGSSAGAFGAQLNYERVATSFPGAEVHVLADSGQMVTPSGTLQSTWFTHWGVSVPAACTQCTTDFSRFPAYLADTYPASRFGLLAWDRDVVLRTFFAYPADTYSALTLQLLSSSYDGRANARYFLKRGTQHTFLGGLETLSSTPGVTLNAWVTQWVAGDAAWNNVQEP